MSEKLEKIKKLSDVLVQLKTEFVGLDSIIDEIGKSITPWYITPEVLERPVVISLWGMSGVGKTSLIRRLLELLELQNSLISVDCGSEAGDNDNRSISRRLYDYFMVDEVDSENRNNERTIFIFDEFQHARFIDESGCEVRNQSIQPIFTLIDSGKLEFTEICDYDLSSTINFIGDLKSFLQENPKNGEIKLEDGSIKKKEDVKRYLNTLGYFYYNRALPTTMFEDRKSKVVDDDYDPFEPLPVLDERVFRSIVKKLIASRLKQGVQTTVKDVIDEIKGFKTLGELFNFLNDTKNILQTPLSINVSKSLVFCLGNLDEAFQVSGDMTADLDADVFYEETSKITIGDIKEALRFRFRPEQIARFGNNLIKYPTLGKQHFKDIIKKEIDRICNEARDKFKVDIKVTNTFLDLIYSEGVFPTQGVRPVLSTINTLFTPLLSDIILYTEGMENPSVEIDTKTSNFKVADVQVDFRYSDGVVKSKNLKLSLGTDRNPENRKTRYICGVHEAGHAIIMSYLTGKLPLSIVAVSTNHGGFCVTHDKDRIGEIDCIQDIKNDICISAGGWWAEDVVFPDKDRRLLGSGSDIDGAWNLLTNAAYKCGLEKFALYAKEGKTTIDGIPLGVNDEEAMIKVREFFKNCMDTTKKVLEENKKLLLIVGKELGDKGDMTQERFLELIKDHGSSLCEARLEEALENNSFDYYKKQIEELLEED